MKTLTRWANRLLVLTGAVMMTAISCGQTVVEVPGSEAQKLFMVRDKVSLAGMCITTRPGCWVSEESTASIPLRAGGFSGDEICRMVNGHLYHSLIGAGAVIGTMPPPPDNPNAAGHILLRLRFADASGRTNAKVDVTPTDPASTESQAIATEMGKSFCDALEAAGLPGGRPEQTLASSRPNNLGNTVIVTITLGDFTNQQCAQWFAQRGSWCTVSEAIYNGLANIWKTQRDALVATVCPSATPPAKDSTTQTLAKKFWKGDNPPQTQSELQGALDALKLGLNDRTFFYFKVKATLLPDGVVELDGATNSKVLAKTAEDLMYALGRAAVRNKIALLPSGKVIDKLFGTVIVSEAVVWDEPRNGSISQTQLFIGEPVYILDILPDNPNWTLIMASDGYVGWIESQLIKRQNTSEFAAYHQRSKAIMTCDVSEGTSVPIRLASGAILPIAERVNEQGIWQLALPDGSVAHVHGSKLNMIEGRGMEAIRAGIEYYMTPYVFGGRSRTGLDCSGLSGIAWQTVGLTLPRDAFQQVIVGKLVGVPWALDFVQPGDIIFFVDPTGRVYHAGLCLGGKRFLHCVPPQVHVSSLDPNDPLFDQEWLDAFAFIRRPMP